MDIETIKNVAALARIRLTRTEEEKMKGELSSILGYVEQLNEVNTDGVEPLYQTTGLINSMREDAGLDSEKGPNNNLVGQAPDKSDGFVKVKSVLNK